MLPMYCEFLFVLSYRDKHATVGDTDKQFPLLASGKTSVWVKFLSFGIRSSYQFQVKFWTKGQQVIGERQFLWV